MTVATAIAAILLFMLGLRYSGLIRVCGEPVAVARQAVGAMRDPEMDELEKERIVQRAALRLFGALGSILWRGAVVTAVSAVPILLSDLAGLTPAGDVVAWLSRPDVIVISTVALIAVYLGARRAGVRLF